MSYASGLMMGTAIIQGLRQLLGYAEAFDGMGGGMRGMGGRNSGGMRGKGGRNISFDSGLRGNGDGYPVTSRAPRRDIALRTFELVSALPGRRRYRIGGMDEAQAKLLEEMLGKISYISDAKANPLSGSLLIVYDAEMESRMDELAAALKTILLRNSVPVGAETDMCSGAPALSLSPSAGSITYSVHRAVYSFSTWLKRNTCGLFDASSLISLLFLIRGVRKLLLTQQFPSGSQLIWWAVSLMRGWRVV